MNNVFNQKLAAMMLVLLQGRRIRRTTLNKLLFFADLVHLVKFGWTISGSTYLRLQFGPVPEESDASRAALVKTGFLTEECESRGGFRHHWYRVAEDRVDLERVRRDLTADELDVLDRVRRRRAPRPAWYLAGRRRQFEPWVSTLAAEVLDFSNAHKDQRLIAWVKRMKLI